MNETEMPLLLICPRQTPFFEIEWNKTGLIHHCSYTQTCTFRKQRPIYQCNVIQLRITHSVFHIRVDRKCVWTWNNVSVENHCFKHRIQVKERDVVSIFLYTTVCRHTTLPRVARNDYTDNSSSSSSSSSFIVRLILHVWIGLKIAIFPTHELLWTDSTCLEILKSFICKLSETFSATWGAVWHVLFLKDWPDRQCAGESGVFFIFFVAVLRRDSSAGITL